MTYTWLDLGFYFLLYSFLGWCAEVACCAVARHRFTNRGFLSLPLLPSYGVTLDLLLLVLPSLTGRYILQFVITLIVLSVVENMADHFIRRACKKLRLEPERSGLFSGSRQGLIVSILAALAFLLSYLVIHPLLMALALLMPPLLKRIVVIALLALVGLDLLAVMAAVRTGDPSAILERQEQGRANRLASRLYSAVWRRLQKSYPGIGAAGEEEQERYVFARGLCMDKVVWVFLIAALLGCIIEFFYCGLVNGEWMNRSSVLYGPFSFVWGLGAVVLTITLQRLAEKNDRYVFGAGFVIGGAYEYMCSVVTELVFGTVFWDYSDMPLNIGRRTNVLFCFFWGLLAVVWVKVLYPPMSRTIEKLPALAGKIATWIVVFFILCDAFLTGAAMLRYNTRAVRPQPANLFEQFLDRQYGDERIESRWPNMIVVGPGEAPDA